MKTGCLIMMGCLFFSAQAKAAAPQCSFETKIIYGDDDRRDLYEVQDPAHLAWARSSVALMEHSTLHDDGNGYSRIVARTFGTKMKLCEGERFREQISAAYCSGALVTPNTVLTAGHCIQSDYDCRTTRFVFDYAIHKAGHEPSAIANSSVYNCKRVIHTIMSYEGADFALIQLERPVTDRAPLVMGSSFDLDVFDPLAVIGYPSGLPTKIDANGHVRNNTEPPYFEASLDTFGGNSGSPVINRRTGHISGVLVRGDFDFIPSGGCNKAKRCKESGCRGEDVTRIEEVRRVFGL